MSTFTLTSAETGLLTIAVIWELIWKGLALWKSAKRNDKIWFVVLLIVNTLGILDILYLFVFSKREDAGKSAKSSE